MNGASQRTSNSKQEPDNKIKTMATNNQNIYTDDSIFPYGKAHKGKKFIDVPADYFMWIYRDKAFAWDLSLHAYIKDNMEALKLELKDK